MSGRLTVLSLENKPKYDPLSYICGSSADMICINMKGGGLIIVGDLHRMFKMLCAQEGQIPVLWVDAICVSQEDFIKRSHQVSWIGSIHEAAQEVGICAGSASEGDEDYIAASANPKSAPTYDMTLRS
jgi:hypothetical protein